MLIIVRIISVIGYSGSGKTTFIIEAIKRLKNRLNYNIAVVKNIHEHQIDEPEKDTFKFAEVGAKYSITKNITNETTIFIKDELKLEQLIDWLAKGPFNIDLIFTEGFRKSEYPAVLCLKELEELHSQLDSRIEMITGIIDLGKLGEIEDLSIPIVDIHKNFNLFLQIFNISD